MLAFGILFYIFLIAFLYCVVYSVECVFSGVKKVGDVIDEGITKQCKQLAKQNKSGKQAIRTD